ncbi:preprotein translocase subunit SecG [Patescibacteria group bacterium]|nr:preprotein translocase subunit SecG [Patescibacteria group bacterium]
MKSILLIIQILLSVTLIVLILLQTRSGGLGNAFGFNMDAYSTRRGVEKVIFKTTIVLTVLFFISSIIQLVI